MARGIRSRANRSKVPRPCLRSLGVWGPAVRVATLVWAWSCVSCSGSPLSSPASGSAHFSGDLSGVITFHRVAGTRVPEGCVPSRYRGESPPTFTITLEGELDGTNYLMEAHIESFHGGGSYTNSSGAPQVVGVSIVRNKLPPQTWTSNNATVTVNPDEMSGSVQAVLRRVDPTDPDGKHSIELEGEWSCR
jgi:hypothetical protein